MVQRKSRLLLQVPYQNENLSVTIPEIQQFKDVVIEQNKSGFTAFVDALVSCLTCCFPKKNKVHPQVTQPVVITNPDEQSVEQNPSQQKFDEEKKSEAPRKALLPKQSSSFPELPVRRLGRTQSEIDAILQGPTPGKSAMHLQKPK